MRKFRRLLSILLIIAMLTGMVPFIELSRIAYAAPAEGAMTNSSTVVDLDALREKVTDETDTDNDGLCDQIEKILATDINNKDTDGDGLDDLYELENGLDPLKADTNDDGLGDLVEITEGKADIEKNSLSTLVDTDQDGTPNIEDSDNDGDGIDDYIDISPFSSTDNDESHTLKVTTTGEAAYIKIQIQPADIENLYKNNQIMNWPVDKYGQISDFDGSKDDMKVIPMLEVKMDSYPDAETRREYGYILLENNPDITSDDRMLVPLQRLEGKGKIVGMAATIYLPANTGTQIGEGKYEVELETKLTWSLNIEVDNITQDWGQTGTVQYNGRNITFVDFDYDYDKEYLGSDIGDLNHNGKPDMAVFWLKSYESKVDGRIISHVYARYYYDLEYNEDDNVYQAAGSSIKTLSAFYNIPGYKNKDQDPDSSLLRTFNGKFNINLDKNKLNTVNYSGDTTLTVKPTPTPGSDYAEKLWSIRGDITKGYINIENHGFYQVQDRNQEPLAILSNIRDSYYKYDDKSDTVWYLYEIYDSNSDSNQIIMKRSYKSGDNYVTQTETLLSGLPVDAQTWNDYYRFRDFAKALALDISDVNGDGKDDLMLTDRRGYMYIITDCNSAGWQDRMVQIPDRRDTDKIAGQTTRFYDFNNNGTTDLVGIQAVRDSNSGKTDLNFRISIKSSIQQSSKFISKEYEAFKITGLQVEEKNGAETATISGEQIDSLLNMAVVFEYSYLHGDLSIDDTVNEYKEEVLGNDADSVDILKGNYDHVYTAVMDITDQIESDIGRRYQEPKPVVILTLEKDRYLNLDDLEDTDFTGRGVSVDVSGEDLVSKRQMMVKWVQEGNMLSPSDINEMVDNNPNDVSGFSEDQFRVKENLAHWNIGLMQITAVGDNTVIKAVPYDAKVYAYDKVKKPSQAFLGLKMLLGIEKPLQTIGNVGWEYEVKLARYNSMSRVGRAATGIGLVIDVACAIHSGILYGQEMGKVGGTTFGIVTGITYGALIFSSSALSMFLLSAGPAGWAIVALIAVDGLLALFFDSYDSVVAQAIGAVMKALYDAKQYPGTIIRKVEQTDDPDKNKVIQTNMDNGYTVGSEVETLSEYETSVRAATKSTPANKKSKLENSYANLYIWNTSKAIKVDNERDRTRNTVYKRRGYWYHDKTYEFDNTLTFDKAGMNLKVKSKSKLDYKLIEKVTEKRYVIHTSYDYEYIKDDFSSSANRYYDVVPNELSVFRKAFTFITTDDEPDVKNNEIALIDADGDGLLIYGTKEIDRDVNIIDSDPNKYDTDDDGLADNYEAAYGTNPRSSDTDGDGLTDFEEIILGTDPTNADTDGDGISDYEEARTPVAVDITINGEIVPVQAYSSPLAADTDGDGLNDDMERTNGTNPASKFTSGQELYDGNEFAPSFIKEFDDINADQPGETVTLDLNENITDNDGDDLIFDATMGEVDDNNIWTYTYNPDEDGAVVEVEITANDLKGGKLSGSFQVYDTSGPFVANVKADTPEGTKEAKKTSAFEEALSSNQTFTIKFNEGITLENTDGIVIKPMDREELDVDGSGNPVSVAASVYQQMPNTITVSRINDVVENGIEYKLVIPKEVVKDTSDNFMEKDYELTFRTVDTISPEVVSITSYVYLDSPLVIGFSEDIDIMDYTLYIEDTGSGEKHSVAIDVYDDKSVKAVISSNQLDSYTTFRLYDPDMDSLSLKVSDRSGNSFATRVEDLENDLKTFTTGHVAGPQIQENKAEIFMKDCYSVTVADGQIRINFDEPLLAGPDFDSIVLSYDRSIAYWNSFSSLLRQEIKRSQLDGEIGFDGDTLVIEPTPYFSDMSYSVFIPEKALIDTEGNYIKEDWQDPDDRYLVIHAGKTVVNAPEVKFIYSLQDTSATGIYKAMIQSYVNTGGIEPSKVLVAVFPDEVIQAPNEDITSVTLWKLSDDGIEESQVSIDEVFLPPNASGGFGSFVMIMMLDEVLEKGKSYKFKVPEGIIQDAITIPPLLTNDYQEIVFNVENEGFTLSGGTDFDETAILGQLRVDEGLWIVSKYKKYMDMVGGYLSYQWYRGAVDDADVAVDYADAAQEIPGANDMIYIPEEADVGSYLFLKLTFDYPNVGTKEFMSPALGPVMAAFKTGSDLISLSVIGNGSELLADFSNDKMSYQIAVPVNVPSVKVNADFDSALNTYVTINGIPAEDWSEDNGLDLQLEQGKNIIIVQSTAEDFETSKVFFIEINRSDSGPDEQEAQLAPEARFVRIANEGDTYTGKTLTGQYEYYDELGRDEEGTTYQWYRQDDDEGNGGAPITGATGLTYTLADSDGGKYVYFTVTPKAQGSTAGNTEESWWIGPVQQVDDKETSITDISVKYEGQELLTAFDPHQKTYEIKLESEEDDSTVTVAAAGDNISINGLAGNTHMIDFYENDLIEVRDVSNGSSYYMAISDMPFPDAASISGENTVEIPESGEAVSMQEAVAYDQYGEIMEDVDFEWTVPPGYDYQIEGEHNQVLTIYLTSTAQEGTLGIRASVKSDETVYQEKDLSIQTEQTTDDTTPPVVDDGTIGTNNITDTGVTLIWNKATDDISDQNALQYLVYKSNSSNIDTVANMEANGTPVGAYEEDITGKEVTGLTGSTNYYFNVIVQDEAGNKTAYTMNSITTAATPGGSNSGNNGGLSSAPSTSVLITSSEDAKTSTASTTISSTTDENTGIISAKVKANVVEDLVAKAKEFEAAGQKAVVELKVEAAPDTKAVEIEIPGDAFKQVSGTSQAALKVDAGIAAVTFDEEAVDTISGTASGGNISMRITKVEKALLTGEVQAKVGDRPVYNFTVMAGNSTVSDFNGGYASISVPYSPEPGEKKNSIIVYYIDAAGKLKTVRGGYDEETGTVNFKTSHFSEFAVGYNEVTFEDVPANSWYQEAVGFMAARSIVNGVGGGRFAPENDVTRADFLIMVMNSYSIELDSNIIDNFSDAGDKYYTKYLGTAKRLGLVSGVGNNLYLPAAAISRQDMFVILYRILDKLGELPEGNGSKNLESFTDTGEIADYAMEAIKLLVETETIRGDGKKLTPKAASTRAEAVQVLYNLLSK